MAKWDFRRELQKIEAALYEEEELTQTEHYDLLRFIAGKEDDKAIELLHTIMERKARVIKVKSRLAYLEVERAKELLNKENDK